MVRGSVATVVTLESTIKDIETAVRKLSRDELSAFRAWFLEFDAEAWDRQFEQDVRAGTLGRISQ